MPRSLVVTAPARANLIGNPSDQYGGNTLACTLPLRARVTIEGSEHCVLESGSAVTTISDPDDLRLRGDELDLGRAVLSDLGELAPCRIRYETEIPRQSGVAGSTALVVALCAGLLEWKGEPSTGHALAERAREIERSRLGIQCGFIDHYACTFGGIRFVDLRDKERDHPPADAPWATVEDLTPFVPDPPFIVAFTGVRHSSGAVHRPIRERWLAGESEVVSGYERIARIGVMGKRALLERDFERLGELMNENHAIQRGLGGSGEANDSLIEAARAAGAPGAKLAGAGGGGTIVVLWPDQDAAPLERALRTAGARALWRTVPLPGVRIEG